MKPQRRTVSHRPAQDPFVDLCPTQESARDTLVQLAQSLTFAKVVSVQVQAKHWMGEAVEVPIGHAEKETPKNVFFDKFGRCRGPLKVGPITLVQCPQGPDHPTSVPVVGEILVGTSIPNERKSHLKFVLRGWSSNAKPLWELFRMVRFGTRMTEAKIRDLLIQLPCMMTFCNPDQKSQRDEIYVLARMVLQGNLRPIAVLAHTESPELAKLKEPATEIELMAAKQTLIGSTAIEFMDMCTIKLNCPSLQEKFQDLLIFEAPAEPAGSKTPPMQDDAQSNAYAASGYSATPSGYSTSYVPPTSYLSSYSTSFAAQNVASAALQQTQPLFAPSTYFSAEPKVPTSPKESATSPQTPASPKESAAPASPVQAPASPVQAPASPKAPVSPIANIDDDF